jgi:hypothetical protein
VNVKFNNAVDRFIHRARDGAQQRTRAVAVALLSRVIDRSPVDTGRFRASWNIVSGEDADLSVAKEGKNDGSGVMAKSVALQLTNAYVVSNNLPYGPALEAGYSKQAPQGVVRLSIIDVKTKLEVSGTP